MGVEASASAAGVGLAPPLVLAMAMPELRRKPIGLSSRLAVLVLGDETYVCVLYFSPRSRKMIKPNSREDVSGLLLLSYTVSVRHGDLKNLTRDAVHILLQ